MSKAKGRPSKHGGTVWLKHGVLPVGKRQISREVDRLLAEMVQDMGGPAEVTAAQRVLLSVIRQDLIYLSLVSAWANSQPSIITDKGEVLPALSNFFLAAQGVVTRNAEKLGLERVSIADNLEAYLAKATATAGEGTPKATGKRARSQKIVDPGARGEGGDE